jgi:hypothetical protein
VFNWRHYRDGVHRFFLSAARNNCDHHNSTGGDQSNADAIANAAQGLWRKEKSAEDGGFSV